MKFIVKFAEKPKNEKKKMAIRIANDCICEIKDGIYSVHFNEINQNLRDLLRLSGDWSTAEFIVDEGNADPVEVERVVNCYDRSECKGMCRLWILPHYNLDRLIYAFTKDNSLDFLPSLSNINEFFVEHGLLLKDPSDDKYIVNKEEIRNLVKKRLSYAQQYCEKIDESKMLSKIDELPNEIVVHSRKETIEDVEESDQEYDEDEGEIEILTENEISKIKAIAEVIAPIFSKAIMAEFEIVLKEALKEFPGNTEKKEGN